MVSGCFASLSMTDVWTCGGNLDMWLGGAKNERVLWRVDDADFLFGGATMAGLLSRWPFFRQLIGGGDGTGPEAMSEETRALRPRLDGAQIARSVCP